MIAHHTASANVLISATDLLLEKKSEIRADKSHYRHKNEIVEKLTPSDLNARKTLSERNI